jgi:hypothetical protein
MACLRRKLRLTGTKGVEQKAPTLIPEVGKRESSGGNCEITGGPPIETLPAGAFPWILGNNREGAFDS